MPKSEKVALCPYCDECPELTLDYAERKAVLEEDGRRFELSAKTWNALLEKARSGELKEI